MRVAFIWTGLVSCMADCWRRLASEPGVELRIIQDVTSAAAKGVSYDVEQLMRGLKYELNTTNLLDDWRPDIIFAVGWHSKICRAVVTDERFKSVPKVCCFDMPWRWKLRCLVAPLVLWRFLNNYQAAFVPGIVCARYAKWLGFKNIYKGLLAIDVNRFINAEKQKKGKYFLYVGRNSSEKRLEDIRAAHRLYKEKGGKLELRMYGKGLEEGFVNPEEVPALMYSAAAFVLASEFDAWPLVLLEAMSAGCPVIASDKCTNRSELGKNWRVFKCGDVQALARELLNAEEQRNREDGCAEICREENLELARQYDCGEWVNRVKTIIKEVAK